MSVSLEPVVPAPLDVAETVEEPAAPQVEETATIVQEPNTPEVEEAPAPVEEATAPQPPAPNKRGRPKKDPVANAKAPAPKKAVRMKPPQPPTPESSDGEPLDRDDMETLLLDYLIKRKQTQQDARRNMWAQLADLR